MWKKRVVIFLKVPPQNLLGDIEKNFSKQKSENPVEI
jgi:hypothetical protein